MQGEGTGRAVKLARMVHAPLYVVHVMSQDDLCFRVTKLDRYRATGCIHASNSAAH